MVGFSASKLIALMAAICLLGFGCASGEIEHPVEDNSEEINGDNAENQKPGNQSTAQPGESTVRIGSGGGDGESENYRARVTIGAPAPAGIGESSQHRVVMGIGAAEIAEGATNVDE